MKLLLARVWPLVLFGVAIAMMVSDGRADPFDPNLVGTSRYGHNHDGALQQMAVWAAVELVALYVVLWPGSDRIWRAIVALLLCGAWTLFSLAMMMHAGGIVAVHGLWLLAAEFGIVVVLVSRIVRRR